MHSSEGAHPGTTALDDFARTLFARLIRHLILEDRIPASDREATLQALESQPLGVFHFEESTQPVAVWFTSNFEQLLPVLAEPLAESAGLLPAVAAQWLTELYRYTHPAGGNPVASRIAAAEQLKGAPALPPERFPEIPTIPRRTWRCGNAANNSRPSRPAPPR